MKIITTNLLNRFWKNGVKPIKAAVEKKLDTAKVINNLLTTAPGYALDARQGKVLQDQVDVLNTGLARCEIVHCGSFLPGEEYTAVFSTAARVLVVQAQQSEWGIYGHDVVIPGLYCAFGLNIAFETEYRLQVRGNIWQDHIQVYYSYVTGGLDTQKIFLDVFGIL